MLQFFTGCFNMLIIFFSFYLGNQCFSWGWNEHGMCGNETEENVCLPQPVESLSSSELLLIGCGAGHSLAFCSLPSLDITPSAQF